MDGWISLHRKIRNNPVFNDNQLLRLWLICLTEAYFKPTTIMIGKQSVFIDRGQFPTGRFDLHRMYNDGLSAKEVVSEKTVWRWLEKLEKLDFLTINSTNKYSVVTLVNWDKYQNNDQQIDQQMTNKRPTDDQQMTTKNKDNNSNKEKKVNKEVKEHRPETTELTDYLIFWLRRNNPNARIPASLDKWHDEMDKLERIDNYDTFQIRSVIDWCQQDSFWKSNILSAPKLREKISTLILQMQRGQRPTGGKVTSFERLKQLAKEAEEREASGHY